MARLARAGLIRMLDLLGDTPALVLSDLGEVLAQNRSTLLLTGDLTGLSGNRRPVSPAGPLCRASSGVQG